MSFPLYPKYKDSGVEWLGEVPGHWEVKPLKVVASFNDDVLPESFSADEEIEYVDIGSVSLAGGIERTETLLYVNAPSRARRKVRDGDVIASTVRTYLKAIAPVVDPPANMIVSTGFAVIRPGIGLVPHFAKFALQTNFFVDAVISLSTGVSYPAINASEMAGIAITVPPLPEQTQIAAFLDRETAKIDELVAEQRRLMELLKEKRQAVISHAVTQGLNPDAPMKPSSIEWLGDVPAHWHRAQVGRVCRQVSDGPHFSPNYVADGVMFLSARNIGVDSWHLDDAKFISEADYLEFCRRVIPEKGDVLYTKGGTTGIARVVDLEDRFQVWVHVAVLKVDHDLVSPYYLAYALNSVGCYEQSQLHTRGATNQDLGLTRMTKIWFALPPLHEQLEIRAFLHHETAKLDTLTAEAQRAVDLLQERRTALISAAVTGQIDVRGAC